MTDGPIRQVEGLVGATSIGIADVESPWESATRTQVVTLASGERVVLQRSPDRRGMGRRVRLARLLPQRAPVIPWAQFLSGDARAIEPFVVTRFAPGIRGNDMLGNDRKAAALASHMGLLVPALASVPNRGLRLSTLWGNPARLVIAARRWLERSEPLLGSRASATVRRMIGSAPAKLGGAPAAFAHGDFAPVNVIVRDGVIVALLDLERARVAHPLFDAAWWRLLVRSHHPDRWPVAGRAFFSAGGLDLVPQVVAQLDLIAVLQCLEMSGSSRSTRPATRASWASRLQTVLDWR